MFKFEKPSLISRAIAKALDFVILLLITYPVHLFLPPLADLVAVVFVFVADAFPGGRSPGKRMLQLMTVHVETGKPCGLKQSLIRNLPFGLFIFFAVIPTGLGYVFLFFVSLPLIILEVYLLLTLDSQRRLGDVIADTVVVKAPLDDPDKLPGES
ncbi:MAG: RDD family protein [Deltaproteobacteria bacterium]|nr:RDD family protein [Deltaproteobacteria bacterium]